MPDTTPTITSRSGVLLVVCAPSGTGKTTLIRRLRDEFPNFAYSISCTTRAPRGHETDGKDYHFLSVEEFLRRRDAGFFAEWANVHGNYYGTPLAPVLETLKAGQDVLFDIDVQGAAQLHLSLPRGQYVFLLPPSLSELERRLRGRGTDDEASIARRLSNAASEIRQAQGSMHGSSTTIWTRPMTSCARSTLPRRSTPHTARGWQTPFWKDELMAQLIVALDYTNAEDALATAESLRGCPIWMKVGLELFTHEGPAVVKKLKDMGFKVMLDLKMFDIPNTVAGGVRSACLMGVDLITLHALGGERMIHAAVDAVRQSAEEGGPKPLLFAVTVLTSMAPGELPGYGENLSGLAADLAAGGQAWGLDGVVCSGHEVEAIKSRCPGLMCLTPGIRPASGSASDDQRRIMTPAQAVRIGSDFLVVGRPITKAPVPADAARAILDEMEKA